MVIYIPFHIHKIKKITAILHSIVALLDQKREIKPFFKELDKPLVIAHRGGSAFPENTLPAFQHAFNIGADMIEFDIQMTKDGQLVVIHDDMVDRTTNGHGPVSSFTLAELKQLDAGYSYTDHKGKFRYRNQGITIPTVNEVFEKFPNSYLNIDIKSNDPVIVKKLWELIRKYNMENQVLIFSFNQKIVNQFNKVTNGRVAVSSGNSEVLKFVALHRFLFGSLYKPKVDVIQIPTKVSIFNLANEMLIQSAHKRNMQVYYWTINNGEEMKRLLQLGADGIITDYPEVLIKIVNGTEGTGTLSQ